jgi:pyrroloquinoline quinone biosynthesis protein D
VSAATPQRVLVEGGLCLRIAPHVKFRHDEMRGRWVVLGPERLLLPDDTAVEILKLVDGRRSVDTIITELARHFDAPRDVIGADVVAMLQDLVDKGMLAS